jgi:hypothetical protein
MKNSRNQLEMNNSTLWLAHSEGYSGRSQSQIEHLSEVEKGAVQRCPEFLKLSIIFQ